jgi:hypothetical protein
MERHTMAIFESIFDLAYLGTVWTLVVFMARRLAFAPLEKKGVAGRFALAFGLLALGDSFHVGFRVLATAIGNEGVSVALGGIDASLLGLGSLATAYTMTGFYMLAADAIRLMRGGKRDALFWAVESLLAVRLVLMALPGNGWESAMGPYWMGIARNAPLTLAGGALAVSCLRSPDAAWKAVGWSMAVSYACYLPVILFAAFVPALGALMIPKTVAYVAMGIIAYRGFFGPSGAPSAHRSAIGAKANPSS